MNDTNLTSDSYRKVTAELQNLKMNNGRLALAVATAGHDLRQRLHSLLRAIELLTSSGEVDRMEEFRHRAKSIILGLAADLEQLALHAQEDSPQPAPSMCCFEIASLLQQIRAEWEAEATAKRLLFVVHPSDCSVESDRRLLSAIMDNIVGNAIRHTSEGGVRIESVVEGQSLVLAVSDTGPGISAADLRRSFSFSARCVGTNTGMGFGLSIARRTAEMLGHEFYISTAPTIGTCIRLRVPLSGQTGN